MPIRNGSRISLRGRGWSFGGQPICYLRGGESSGIVKGKQPRQKVAREIQLLKVSMVKQIPTNEPMTYPFPGLLSEVDFTQRRPLRGDGLWRFVGPNSIPKLAYRQVCEEQIEINTEYST